jgi:hypothetical protein
VNTTEPAERARGRNFVPAACSKRHVLRNEREDDRMRDAGEPRERRRRVEEQRRQRRQRRGDAVSEARREIEAETARSGLRQALAARGDDDAARAVRRARGGPQRERLGRGVAVDRDDVLRMADHDARVDRRAQQRAQHVLGGVRLREELAEALRVERDAARLEEGAHGVDVEAREVAAQEVRRVGLEIAVVRVGVRDVAAAAARDEDLQADLLRRVEQQRRRRVRRDLARQAVVADGAAGGEPR